MRKFLIGTVGALVMSVAGATAAQAFCSDVKNCNKVDFDKAASEKGCGLLFIESRNTNCKTAGENLHTAQSCGPINQPPPACANDRDNRAILGRLTQCLSDRKAQQQAFAGGLKDVEAARKVKYQQDQMKAIKTYLDTIGAAIDQGQSGHAIQISGVETAAANCRKFLKLPPQ